MAAKVGVDDAMLQQSFANTADADPWLKLLMFEKTVRIAATGDVMLTRLERAIIDTPEFQRLRGIRQLGQVNIVYPTALHTRFDHSLGTLAMAQRMMEAIINNTHSNEDERNIDSLQRILIRLYALLHDITHVPFGHTIEDELEIFLRHDENDTRIEHFLGPRSTIGGLIVSAIGEDNRKRLLAIYRYKEPDVPKAVDDEATPATDPESELPIISNDDVFIYDLVSNTVCADLLDYLQRDNYFCNLGISLEYRFLNFLYLARKSNRRRVFVRLWKVAKKAPRRDTLTDLTRLLEARYLVAERAYFHHTKLVAGAMIGRALQEANLAKEITEEDLYNHSDDSLLRRLLETKSAIARMLAGRLTTRRLHKTLAVFRESDFGGVQEHQGDVDFIDTAHCKVRMPTERKRLEDRLCDELDIDRGSILLYGPDRKMNLKVARMKVLWNGRAIEFQDINDEIISPRLAQIINAHRKLWGIHVFVRDDLTDTQRQLVREALEIEFLTPEDQQKRRRDAYYTRIVELSLVREGSQFVMPDNPAEFIDLKESAGAELAAVANSLSGDETFGTRRRRVLRQFFKSTKKE